MRIGLTLEHLMQDLRFAVRGFQRSPGFTVTVILMLAVGIGSNTAIFSLVDKVLLRDLPYPESQQLVLLYEAFPNAPRNTVSPANWLDWQRQSNSFEKLGISNFVQETLTGDGDPELIAGQLVSAEIMPVLRVRPLLGRLFNSDDDRPEAPRVVILSERWWQHRFGGDPAIIGKKIELDAEPRTVIGVMSHDFHFLNQAVEYWSPYAIDRNRNWRTTAARNIPYVLGRLRPGVTIAAAQAEMRALAGRLEQMYEMNRNTSVNIVPLRAVLTDAVRNSLWLLLAAVSVLLIITCFNIASIMLARSSSRQREMAVRVSLGAGRSAIFRQVLVESLVLASIGGIAGFLVSLWGVSALLELAPRNLIRLPDLQPDRWILLYSLGLSAITGFTFGLVPAIAATRGSLSEHLHTASRSITRSAGLRKWLVVAQVTMTVILLCGAGLLLRSFAALNSVQTGVDASEVLTMQISMPPARYDRNQQVDFVTRVLERIQQLPGVQSAGATRSLPVIGPTAGVPVEIQGAGESSINERPAARIRIATPGYFKTVGVPIVRGREFVWDDQRPNADMVFIVNEAFVRTYLRGKDPLETSMKTPMTRDNTFGRIIGVARDVREFSLRDDATPTVFYNQRHLSYSGMTIFIRTNRDDVRQGASRVIHDDDSRIAVTQVRTLSDAFRESIGRDRLNAFVTAAFAVIALLLASFGLYGLLSYIVTERTREIGIRMALGAESSSVLRMVMKHGLSLVLWGGIAGLLGAIGVSRLLQTLLFGVSSNDPATFGMVTLLMILVSAVASYVPAYRATRVDPVVALRQD